MGFVILGEKPELGFADTDFGTILGEA